MRKSTPRAIEKESVILKKLRILDSIEKSEVLPLVLLFTFSFLNGMALVFFETTANTLFLIKHDIKTLPYVYILTALVSVIFGYFYDRLESRIPITKLLRIILLFVMTIILFFFILIKLNDSEWVYLGLMVSKDLVWIFISIEFGILSSMIFNIRQGKRLFGLLMSGEILAGIIGGISINLILNYIETVNLLFLSSLILLISFLLLSHILHRYKNSFAKESKDELETEKFSYKELFQDRYYLLIFAISALSFFVFYFIDYIFYYSVEAKFTNEKELAGFFGIFYAILNGVNLFSSIFVSGAMLSRFGILSGIVAIPVIALVSTSSLLIAVMSSLGISFFILLLVKLLNEVFDSSIFGPTLRVIYQSIPTKKRMKVLSFKEMVVEPISMGLVGLILLFIAMFDNIDIVYYLILLCSLVWILLGKMLKKYYILSLEKLLNQREVIVDSYSLYAIDTNIFLNGIKSDNEIEVIYCLDSLVKIDYKDIDTILTTLLSHKSTKVRLNVLEFIEKLDKDNLSNHLSQRIKEEQDESVLNKLLKLYCKMETVDAIDTLSDYINHKNSLVQEGAIIGLLQYGGIDGILIAGKVLNNLFESSKREDQITALNILTNMHTPSFYHLLKKLIDKEDIEIRRQVIVVIGNLKIKKFIPDLFKNLELDNYRGVAVQSLIKFENKIFDDLIAHFEQTHSLESKYAIIKIISILKTEESNHFLLSQLSNPQLSDTTLEKLSDIDYRVTEKNLLEDLLLREVKRVLFYLHITTILDQNSFPNSFLIIKEIIEQKIKNLFLILGFNYTKKIISQSMLNYQDRSKKKRAYAVEVIDNMVSSKIKEIVLPIFEDISSDKKFSSYDADLFYKVEHQDEFIDIILDDFNKPQILRLSIVYEIGKHRERAYLLSIKKLIENEDEDIRQTALWTLSQLEKENDAVDD
ncbi:MAG: MFS transporter [Campylobacterota bacterium]|nr:MFS transporter [Campylobacterota bacterium]